MKPTTSIRPFGLFSFLVITVALLSLPYSANAQLFVCQGSGVSEYDAISGAPINVSLIAGGSGDIAIYNSPTGNILFPFTAGYSIGEYQTDGTTINASFITPGSVNRESGGGLVILGNGRVYVATSNNRGLGPGGVGVWSAVTGAPINSTLVSLTGGFAGEENFVMGIAISGNDLFVAHFIVSPINQFVGTYIVSKYNATTGAVIKANFITGVGGDTNANGAFMGLAVSGNNLFLTNSLPGSVGRYNATTGAVINANFITGLNFPVSLAIVGNNLYVACGPPNSTISFPAIIGEYDATSGAPINANLVTGLTGIFGANCLAVLPEPKPGKYTILLSATDTSDAVPQGTGYATLTVGKHGGVAIAGKLADGESFSTSGVLVTSTAVTQFSINKPLRYPSVTTRGQKGLLSGTLKFVIETGTSDLNGTLEWIKPEQRTTTKYPATIDTTLNVKGSLYMPPGRGKSVLPGFPVEGGTASGTVELSDTSGFILSGTAQLSDANKLIITNPQDSLKVTITPSTGIFKGYFKYSPAVPGGKAKLTDFGGVLFQDQIMGNGFFLGPNGSGTVSLTGT